MSALFSPEYGVPFELVGPYGDRAVFNDPDDADYVGMLTNISGLDSADIRESTEDLTETDGAAQGPNYYSARSVVLEGVTFGHSTASQRAARLDKLVRASNALRGDCTLNWTPSGGVPVFLTARRSQPLRISGGWNKTFQVSIKAADPRIYSQELHESTDTLGQQVIAVNAGTGETFPTYTVLGPYASNVGINNRTTGTAVLTSSTLDSTHGMLFDTKKRTLYYGARRTARHNYFSAPGFEGGPNSNFFDNFDSVGLPALPSGLGGSGFAAFLGLHAPPGPVVGNIYYNPATRFPITNPNKLLVSFSGMAPTLSSNAHSWYTKITWYTSGGAVISTSESSTVSTVTADWKRATFSATAPATTASAALQIGVRRNSALTDGVTLMDGVWIDGVVVEIVTAAPTNATSFYPGLTPGASWVGTPDASESALSDLGLADTGLSVAYDLVTQAGTVWGGLQPGSNVVSSATLPGSGAALIVNWRDAWL